MNEIKYFASEKWILEEYSNFDYSIVQLNSFNGVLIGQNGEILDKGLVLLTTFMDSHFMVLSTTYG